MGTSSGFSPALLPLLCNIRHPTSSSRTPSLSRTRAREPLPRSKSGWPRLGPHCSPDVIQQPIEHRPRALEPSGSCPHSKWHMAPVCGPPSALMLRLPRTAGQPRAAEKAQEPADSPRSPNAVLARPHPTRQPKGWTADQPAPEGHAQDVLHLLNASWFGPLRKSKAAPTSLPFEDSDEEPPPPPRRPRSQQGQQQQRQGQQQQQGADASPTTGSTNSHRSSQGSGGRGGAQGQGGLPAPSLARPILSTLQRQQQDARAAAAIQDLPGIGTWAGRYRLFGRQDERESDQQQQQQQQQATTPDRAAASAAAPAEPPPAGGRAFGAGLLGGSESPVVLRPGGFGGGAGAGNAGERQARGDRPVYGSEQAQEDAWRWRFSRKWATEQQKYYEAGEGGQPGSLVSDDLDPLAFTQACGVGVNLQVQPPTSAQRPSHLAGACSADEGRYLLGLEPSASTLSLCQFDVDASYMSGGVLSAEMSPCGSTHGARAAAGALQLYRSGSGGMGQAPPGALGAAGPYGQGQAQQRAGARMHGGGGGGAGGGTRSPRGPSATRTVLSMANKARDLLQKQDAIEAAVEDRWERVARSNGGAWVGGSLAPVLIDMLGRFKFCVLRVSDGAGHTRFLVRGRAGGTPASLLDAARQEAAAVSRAEGLPVASIEVVGGGIMEWREDTERELYLQPSALVGEAVQLHRASSGESPTKAPYLGDVSGLTASLVRQALPCHFRITTGAANRGASAGSIAANRI